MMKIFNHVAYALLLNCFFLFCYIGYCDKLHREKDQVGLIHIHQLPHMAPVGFFGELFYCVL